MPASVPPGLFITGTDTDAGKTYTAARIVESLVARGLRVGVYKPAASGCEMRDGRVVSGDPIVLWEVAGRRGELVDVCPQCFEQPVAPHVAAEMSGQRIDADLLRSGVSACRGNSDIVIVEGVGGLMSPISKDDYVADVAYELGYPLIVVAPNKIGVINQTLQTVITAATFRNGLEIAGIVLCDVSQPDASAASNRSELEARCVPPVLGQLGWNAMAFDPEIDWPQLAGYNPPDDEPQ